MGTEAAERIWAKILISTGNGKTAFPIGSSGTIPVYDGNEWRVFKNSSTIYIGAENCVDPVKVDVLRQNVVDLLGHYPETVKQLEKLGVRVRALLNKEIKSFEDVVAWSDSLFNLGPVSNLPEHVSDTIDLAYDDIVIEVKRGRDPFYVIPAAPRGSGVNETVDFSFPGARRRYGPRHEFTKLAFTKQIPKKIKAARYRGKTAEGEPQRPRGRPRKDGLIPGSVEARRADQRRERERQQRRDAREKAKIEKNSNGTITPIRRPRRPLARVGQRKASSSY